MARIIFFVAILVLLLVAVWKLSCSIYWKVRNRRNHGKGRVVKRKVNREVRYFVQLYNDNAGWEDIPGYKFDNLGDAMTAMDKALERVFANDSTNDGEEQIMVERSYRRR